MLDAAQASSITADPFKLEFTLASSTLGLEAELVLTCRYERIVWSDSAEWEIFTKNIPLFVQIKKIRNKRNVRLALKERQYHEVRGTFRPSKECSLGLQQDFDQQDIWFKFDDFNSFFHTYLYSGERKLLHATVIKDPKTSLPYTL